ncbi:MAG: alanine racemase [Pseudomonadales bacterium]|nr:alanine racemase [Pseudomonadales bacterium]
MKAIPTASDSRAWATIDLTALQNNLERARAFRPDAHVVAVVKANAYGHGALPVAHALRSRLRAGDCFGVASLDEALELRNSGLTEPILLLEGVFDAQQQAVAVEQSCSLVIHSLFQLDLLQQYLAANPAPAASLTVWLKIDTGMHRLGLSPQEFAQVWQALAGEAAVGKRIIMSHFACADDIGSDMTARQLALLERTLDAAGVAQEQREISVAASSGIQLWPQSHYQWLRPGIMLYGGTAVAGEYAIERGIAPVMTLKARLIAIKQVAAGESIGYGASHVCEREQRIGVISIGYGDGYPRRMPGGTPVLVKCQVAGQSRTRQVPLCGRVSMDMTIVDLTDCPDARVGDEVVLWGEGLPADEIAQRCGTIAYELFCQVTPRVHFIYA